MKNFDTNPFDKPRPGSIFKQYADQQKPFQPVVVTAKTSIAPPTTVTVHYPPKDSPIQTVTALPEVEDDLTSWRKFWEKEHPPVESDPRMDQVIAILLTAPGAIRDAQCNFDIEDAGFERAYAKAAMDALTRPLFAGKEAGQMRFASNDKEREQAIQMVTTSDPNVIALAMDRTNTLRALQFEKNRFEGAKVAAQLLAIKAGK